MDLNQSQTPNHLAAANPAIAASLHPEHQGRGVAGRDLSARAVKTVEEQ